ncbi:MAG: Ldh family oxidoreductase [Clostridia bacterium]|nr:Ldh family oxidoreductase [Clostridia bacterium]
MAAKTIRYSYDQLNTFCMDAFKLFGFKENEARIITDVLLLSDLYGIDSHGVQRLVRYHKGIEKGMIKVDAQPEIVFETPVSAVIDAHACMGQLAGHKAMTLAIEKAKKAGMAIVSVRNSNHFGIAGYYAKMACDQGLMGMAMTNSEAIMVPTFARMAMIGSNPIAVMVPADPYPFLFDASTSVVTRGKLEVYNKNGKPLPEGWALNRDGHPSTDAKDVLTNIVAKNGGGIMPLGGSTEQLGSHKGYGYGMLCEIFCSILSQGTPSSHVNVGGKSGTCHGFMAVDLNAFGDPEAIRKHFSAYLQELRDAPKADGQDRIYTHGEKEVFAYAERLRDGIDVNINTVAEMADMARFLNMDVEKYLGRVDVKGLESSYK